MDRGLTDALGITGIGMGFVFLAILVLWGLMEALVRLFPAKINPQITEKVMTGIGRIQEPLQDQQADKMLAAALAVAAARALNRGVHQKMESKLSNEPSPWQLARRVDSMHRQNAVKVRKRIGAPRNES